MTELNRPDHDDFWLMAEVVQDMDAAADEGNFDRIIRPVVDMESLAYVAEQRAMRVVGPLASQEVYVKLQAAWLDAFIAGALYQKRKMERGK